MVCSLSNYQPISSHIFKQNHASNLSSTFLSSPSSIHLSSDLNICLQFRCNNKKLCSSTPRPLTVFAMVPPKLVGKANKVTGITKPTLEAGKAKPAPPVGPTLGSKGEHAYFGDGKFFKSSVDLRKGNLEKKVTIH